MPRISNYQVNKVDALFIIAIFLIAVLLRMLYFGDYKDTEVYPVLEGSDGHAYYLWAKDIASGDLLGNKAFMKWPLYAYFLGFLFRLFGENAAIIYTLQFLLGAGNCVLIYVITKILFKQPEIALLASLFYLGYGIFIFYEGLLIYSSLSLFLNSLFFLLLLLIQERINSKNLFWLGVFLGLCVLVQANIVLFGICAILWILWHKKLALRKFTAYFICFLAGTSLIIGLVTLRNYLLEKDFVLIAGNLGVNFYIGNHPNTDGTYHPPAYLYSTQEGMFRNSRIIAKFSLGKELKTSEVSRFWFNKGWDFIFRYPKTYLKLLFRKITFLFSPQEIIHDQEYQLISEKIKVFKFLLLDLRLILPLAFFGMVLSFKKSKETALLYIILITLSLSIVLFYVVTRYRISLVPFLAIFASFGTVSLMEAAQSKRYPRLICFAVVLMIIFLLFNHKIIFAKLTGRPSEDINSFDDRMNKVFLYEKKADFQKAMQELKIAEQLHPNRDSRISMAYGHIYYKKHDLKKAEEKFKEAIQAFPINVDAHYNLGFLYNQQKRFGEALVVLEKAKFLDPDDVGVHFELGKAYKAEGNLQKAEEEFNLALKKMSRWRKKDRLIIEQELRELNESKP